MMPRCLLPLFLALSPGGLLHAQYDTIALPFRSLSIEDGLSQGMVNRITQDRYGFMWFATKDGLDRYDGYGFKVYRNKAMDSTTVSENYINSVQEDSKGRLWVGTATKGLDLFDRQREVFQHVHLGPDGDASMVMNVEEDRYGNIWAATTRGLFKVTFMNKLEPGSTALPTYLVKRYFDTQCRIMQDRSGHLWGYLFAQWSFRIRPHAQGQDRIDTLDMHRLGNGPWNEDRNTHVNGILLQDPGSGRIFGIHPYFIAEYDTVTAVPRIVHQVPYPGGTRFETDQPWIDQKGMLWLGCGPLRRFDTRTMTMQWISARDPDLASALENVITVYQDRNGLVWAGSAGYGLIAYDPRIERFNTRPGPSVRWLQPTNDERVLALQQKRLLSIFDPKTRSWSQENIDSEQRIAPLFEGLVDDTHGVVQDQDGLLWLCKGDLVSLDPLTGKAERYRIADEEGRPVARRKSAFPLFQEGDRALWFGCDTNFYRFDKTSHRFTRFQLPITPVNYPYMFVQAIHQDASGVFWLGTIKGLLRLDPGNGEWRHYANDPADTTTLSFDLIFSLLPDPREPERFLWIGTNGGGLNRFEMSTGKSLRFQEADGLPNDVVYGIVPDEEGDLWMSTNKGLSRFTPTTGRFRNYSASDGLQGDEYNRNAFCRLADGTLFFGGVNGFNFFHPKDLTEDDRPAEVRITDVKLMNRSVPFGSSGQLLTMPAYLSKGLEIPYTANMVTFEFATMEYAAPEEHVYQYRLDGFDPDWIAAGTSNSAIYTNLDPGTYTFRVRGRNRDGLWEENGTAFRLNVLPPWWRTWWAYVASVLMLAGGILLYIQLRTKGLKRQKEKLERTVVERTEELSRAKERAELSEKVKQQFLANMSHEIRTPMNAIMGMTATLRRNERLPAQDKYLDAIAESSGNLLVILNDILDLEKLEAGKFELEQVAMAPRAIVENVAGILRYKAEEKGLHFELSVGPDVPERVLGDPTRLNQIILNLAGNAVKFTEHGTLGIAIHLVEHAAHVDILRFTVSDTGIGIPADRISSIFDEFTQADSDTSRKYGGSGLGLAITKRLVQLQQGTIAVESTLGQGSVFNVLLPFARPMDATAATHNAPAAPIKGPSDLRVLLVEDNEFNVMVAQDELHDALPGVVLGVARNGRIAVDMVLSGGYDLVLMDIQMPEMNGYEATRAIRASAGPVARIPIIAMTANVLRAEVDRCTEAGMDGFIPKPFKREELLRTIHRVLSMDRS